MTKTDRDGDGELHAWRSDRQPAKHRLKQLVEERLHHCAHPKTDKRDSKLRRANVEIDVLHQPASRLRPAIPLRRQRIELRLAHTDERQFGRYEKPVQPDEHQHAEQLQPILDKQIPVHQIFTSPKTLLKMSCIETSPTSRS